MTDVVVPTRWYGRPSYVQGRLSAVGVALKTKTSRPLVATGIRSVSTGTKTPQNLGQFLKSLVRDRLADNCTAWTHADHHLPATPIHEGAKGLGGSGKLSRALFEFKLFGFASLNESQQFQACHRSKFY
jgi:hypothetical protein